MGSPLGSILKGNSTAEQLFIWGVLSSFISALLEPFIRSAGYFANSADPSAVFSPEQAADLVERGHLDLSDALDMAKKAGLPANLFQLMVDGVGEPPGPLQLAEALRRGFIQEAGGSPTDPTYDNGIKQSRLQTQWGPIIRALDQTAPSPQQAVLAFVRSMLSEPDARTTYKLLGGEPQWFDLLNDITGEGPTPVEAGSMANRGIIGWTGTGPGVVSFEQAVAESRFKNKWQKPFRDFATYRPPPRTITAMFREGSIDGPTATHMLLDYGVPANLIPVYLTKSSLQATQRAHELTEGEILRLYREQALSNAEATTLLKDHGYKDADIAYILQAADLQVKLSEETAAIAIVKHEFSHGKIDYNTAVTLLDANGVLPNHRDYLLKLWDSERTHGTRDLTEKDIIDAANLGLLTQDAALTRLMGIGFSPDDAALVMSLKYSPPTSSTSVP